MTELLLLALPGYVGVAVFRWFSRSRSRAGWDFLIATGFTGAASYTLGVLASIALAPYAWANELRHALYFYVPDIPNQLDNLAYMLSFAIAGIFAWGLARLLYWDTMTQFLVSKAGMRHPPAEFDALSQLAFVDTPVIVSMDNGQIYIGDIHKVTTDPDEDLRILVIAVFASGSRVAGQDAEGQPASVVYNYAVPYNPDRPRYTYCDFRNIVTIGQFDFSGFLKTRAYGYTIVSNDILRTIVANMITTVPDFKETELAEIEAEISRLEEQADRSPG